MRNAQAVDEVRSSDLWVLLTDGKIYGSSVIELTRLAETMDVIQIPVVLIITGTSTWSSTPAQTKISVGIPFFASAREALILFKDVATGRLTVIDAKGSFAPLKRETTLDLTSWTSLLVYANGKEINKRCSDLAINITRSEGRQLTRAVSLGHEWDATTSSALVDVPTLLAERQIRLED
ncbi:hypothetical protein ABVK25_001078 [Lepraria finkii]|uniref:VWFA domain-containing protein n=1 Tax=Lepraria finkii TaxID=1340010 RepID=A0ABR4BKW8_9LECA